MSLRSKFLARSVVAATLIVASFLAAVSAQAEAANCDAKSLIPQLKTEGKLDGVEAEAAKVKNGEGRFYRIEKDGVAPSYLLGTMHLGDPRLLQLPTPIETAFDQSRRLVIETTDVLDQKKLAGVIMADPTLTMLPNGQTLDDYLDPKEKDRLKSMLSKKGVPLQAVERLQPWFLSSGFMLPSCQQVLVKGIPIVLDTTLALRAKTAGKQVEGLETGVEQLKTMAAIPLKEQMDSFVALLAIENRIGDVFETMIELYLEEHVSTMIPAIEAAVPDGGVMVGAGEGYNSFEEKVILERNRRMADRMVPLLDKGGTFVAVGALHLTGDKGLVALLRGKGYRVTRVTVPVPAAAIEPPTAADASKEVTPPTAATPEKSDDQ
ncbi:TraB/GumN family protein [Jiella sp. MQZ9-1]|uniref:TraB/GumN family protein n=1 Tax=Jiella flava TaxID=2816857 RepID=A0A939JVL0_9HYPH|nr:TraB/GumN family protein [Jiella flava]MBO0664325.1 TraB/GumN family protein [Jiella flava]MCD2472752.1 TraB/GumN family protein [Jiella flava]